ncbi:MAG TPA: class I SAM-dependent methyltransferase [Flavobacteriales bacterium]|nr:methyltransferase [Flavobacteriales bacterium]HRE76155.1 class I SAM-dependent methyltransferase [Flavobacteriales bacterium]HRE96778.1 class I SAM-dependent methyltransferase [Flavobacteriales bacterium]HRJ35751.1 class I SAM-dependent methyltransferase [Flavobacteriales bacterium]HRJ38042.1 class I SAM-dependent methyltransferase [Flavobacteriales bacterium]
MLTISRCPVCDGQSFPPFLTCKDFTVSEESFPIVSCSDCGFLFTNPIPDLDVLGNYYKAESYVSHTSSSKGLINFLYQRVRKITLKRKLRLIQRIAKGNRILDFGCGTGHFLARLQAAKFDVTGVEPDADARAVAEKLNGIRPLQRHELSSLQPGFDVITLWHVLEHLPDLNKDISELIALLAPGGTLLVAVPNPTSGDAELYKEYWAGYDVPRHLYHFSPTVIKRLFEKHGMECSACLPMPFDAYYVSMLSEKHKGGGMLRGFFNGWKSNRRARKGGDKWSSQIYLFQKK